MTASLSVFSSCRTGGFRMPELFVTKVGQFNHQKQFRCQSSPSSAYIPLSIGTGEKTGNLMKVVWKIIGNYLKAVSILLACAVVCGCVSNATKNEMQIETALTAPLSKARSVAIQVPKDGSWSFGDKSHISEGSGQQTAAVFQEMFSRFAKSVSLVKCQRSDCERSGGYFVVLQILDWEKWNHAGSYNKDRVAIRVTVFDAVTDKMISSNILQASGGLGMQDLLDSLVPGYVQSLY